MAAEDDPYAALIPAKPKDDDPYAALIPRGGDVTSATEGAPARITVRPPGAAPPETTASDAFGRGFTSAASFGFRDELAGLGAAGGADPNSTNPADLPGLIYGIGKGAYRKLTGDPEAERLYAEEVKRQREQGKQLAEDQPVATTAGQITGAVALPIGFAARAATWPARAIAAARTGAVQGGLTGLGEAEGDLGERVPAAVEGAGYGLAAGLVASPAISLVGAGVRKILGPTLNIARGLRGLPATEEARRFVDVTGRDVAAGDVGLSGAEAELARARGQPVTALDQFGTNTRALARAAADASPEARAIMEPQLRERFEGQAPRMGEFLKTMSNHVDDGELASAIRSVGGLENRPLYQRAYEAGDRAIGLENPELNTLLSAPAVRDAMKESITRWRDRQVAAGYGNLKAPIDIDPRTGEMVFTNSRGFPTYPNLQLWDYTGRNLEARAARARDAGDNDTASLIGGFAGRLKTALDKEVPEFAKARASAKDFFGSENALDFGRDFFGASTKKDFRERLAGFEKLSDKQKAIAQDGYLPAFIDKVQSAADKQNLLNKIKTSPNFKTEMQTMLGTQKAAQIEDWLRVETLMEQSRAAVSGGSPTSRLLQDALRYASPIGTAAGSASGAFFGDYDPKNIGVGTVAGLLAGAGTKRWNASNAKVMRQVAERLMSSDPAEYSKALQMMTAKPAWRRMLHEVTDALTPGPAALGRVGGTIAGEQQGP